MSMPVSFYALGPKQLERYRAALVRRDALGDNATKPMTFQGGPNDWGDVLDASFAQEDPDDVLERAKAKIEADWEHFGLAYLMSTSQGRAYENAALPEEVFGRGLGVGRDRFGRMNNTVILQREEVARGFRFLSTLDSETLRRSYDASEMARLEIHPTTAWSEPETIESLLKLFDGLRKFFARAEEQKLAVVVSIDI